MSAPDLAPGQIVAGIYGIQSRLGHGGVVATYHAMTAPNRQVALKLYDPALRSFPDVLKLLGRYQMTAAALAARSIAPITESGEDPVTGAPFTVTDFEAHPTLKDLVELCPLSTAEMVTLMGNLGQCVDLLHSHGIVHLALHPNNVFVGPAPAYDVRVLDFGTGAVRKALGAREVSADKARWLAPEQLRNDEIWDARADVFSAALVAFFAASGRSYWRSCDAEEVDLAELRREILGPRVPASQRANELSLELPPAFDAVFARALAASPKDRFATVGEFTSSLALAERGVSVARGASIPVSGAPGIPDVPPPPAQMEAVLSAFEGGRPAPRGEAVGALVADTLAESRPVSETTEPLIEPLDFARANEVPDEPDAEHVGKKRRRPLTYAVGIAALLLGMGGVFAMFSKSKPATRSAEASVPPPPQAVATSPVEPTPTPPSPPAPIVTAVEPAPEATATPTPAVEPAPAPTTAPARPPVWRKPPAAPRPPAKKPCGKFLKRCT
jgi:serine/threonine protein kinase